MAKLIKESSRKASLPAGALVHIGEKKTEQVKITILEYDEMHFREQEAKTIEECFPLKDKDRPTVAWININGIHRSAITRGLFEAIREAQSTPLYFRQRETDGCNTHKGVPVIGVP